MYCIIRNYIIVFCLSIFLISPVLVHAAEAVLLQEWFMSRKGMKQDVIGLRVLNNPNNYSVARWYAQQGFKKGSPQGIIIDGYPAIKDGRTVYVNAGNVEDKKIHTNIYLISYNENADPDTIKVFERMLIRWRFNTNITDLTAKQKIIADVIRLADMADFKSLLENYKSRVGTYPLLKAGSYIKGLSISTWPSWQGALAQELGVAGLPIDPINKLGQCVQPSTSVCWNATSTAISCEGYNKITCWNEVAKKFSGDIGKTSVDVPPSSNIYFYKSDPDGKTLLAGMIPDSTDWIAQNSCIENVLTNVDFESGAIGAVPIGWSESHQQNSTVGISNTTAKSGTKSVKIHQDPNHPWPGTCTESVCTNLPGCKWEPGDIGKECKFDAADNCHLVGPAIYKVGEQLCWGNMNRIMWTRLAYSIANLDFKVGKKYRIQFYYKGTLAAPANVSVSAALGWSSFCTPKEGIYSACKDVGAECPDQPGYCCAYAPVQKKCYDVSKPPAPNISKGAYSDWQLYSHDIVWDKEMDSHVNGSGNKINEVGLAIGYNDTGLNGTDFYIDDFLVGPVPPFAFCSN